MKTFGSSIIFLLSANNVSGQDFGRVLTKGAKYAKTPEPNVIDVKGAKAAKLSREMSLAFEQYIGAKSLKHFTDSRMSIDFVEAQETAAPFVLLRTKTQKNVFSSDGAVAGTSAPSAFSLEYFPMGSKSSKVGPLAIEKGQESSLTVQAISDISDASASEQMEFSVMNVEVSSKSYKVRPSYAAKTHKIDTAIEKMKETSTSKTKTSTNKAPSSPSRSPISSKYTATKSSKDSIPIPIAVTRSITLPEDTTAEVSQVNKSDESDAATTKGNSRRMTAMFIAVGALMIV